MKIALYTGTALPKLGGQELVVDALARQFLAMGHEPIVIAPMPRRPLRPGDAGLPYPVIRHPRFYSTRHWVGWYRWFLLRAHRKHRFDVIHCHDLHPTGYVAALAKERLGVPIVITSHGGDVQEGSARLHKPGMQARLAMALGGADALISIGRFTAEGFARICPTAGPIRHIPNGVDLIPFEKRVARPASIDPAIEAGSYLLFLGRLRDRKGVDVLLEAMAMLPRRTGVELVIAGDGKDRGAIEAQMDRLNLRACVWLVGQIAGEAKVWLLQNSLAVVIPSRISEAFPLVVLEAAAAGKAVIASDIPGLRDLVKPDQTGYLVAEGNSGALADVLGRILDDRPLTRRLGENARATAQAHAWPEIARQHIELYQSCIAR